MLLRKQTFLIKRLDLISMPTPKDKKSFPFLEVGGEMGKQIQAHNWVKTSVGSIEDWPISLRTIVSTMLQAKNPMFLFWGSDYFPFYNDAFVPLIDKNIANSSTETIGNIKAWPSDWLLTKANIDKILEGCATTIPEQSIISTPENDNSNDIHWSVNYSSVRNDQGEIEGVLLMCNKAVDESLTSSDLEESRKQLLFAIDAADMATFDYNPITDKFTGNERLRDWFGAPKSGEVDFSIALESILEQDRERVQTAIADSFVFKNGGKYEIDYSIKNVNTKEERVVLAKGQTYFDNNQTAYRFNGIILDISKHITAERKIRESEESFRLLTEALPHLVWVTDERGKQVYISKSWNEFSGFDQITKEIWESIVHPDDLNSINENWQKCLSQDVPYTSEVRIKRNEGVFRWHKVEGVPLKNEDNKVIRWIGAFSDIHDLKLREAQKDEFISIASHEMKTPLTSAKGYLELLLLTMPTEDASSLLYATKASEALMRLQSFIKELLDVSKIQHGKLNYNFQQFDFISLIKDAVQNVQLTAKKHAIKIEAENKLEIQGDKLRLMQVIINLLTNAIKYSPDANEVKVVVSSAGDSVEVCVIDDGIGLAEEHLEKIFSRYYRVQEHAVHFQGLGVGLFISSQIIERHHGKMWAESEVGKGSKFHFTVPIHQQFDSDK